VKKQAVLVLPVSMVVSAFTSRGMMALFVIPMCCNLVFLAIFVENRII
jgi:hypothetical protein